MVCRTFGDGDCSATPRSSSGWQGSQWRREGETIVRDFELADFVAAMALVNRVADAAEAANHHPDILVHGWNNVRLTLSTHSAGGLTEADFALAARTIDEPSPTLRTAARSRSSDVVPCYRCRVGSLDERRRELPRSSAAPRGAARRPLRGARSRRAQPRPTGVRRRVNGLQLILAAVLVASTRSS